jgi:hypothetical protein
VAAHSSTEVIVMNFTATVLIAASLASAAPATRPPAVESGLRASTVQVVRAMPSSTPKVPGVALAPASGKRSVARVVTGIVLGAAAGTFAGGFVGYKIERGFADCRCDDPGIRGLIIGAPIGAAIGAVLGGKFF